MFRKLYYETLTHLECYIISSYRGLMVRSKYERWYRLVFSEQILLYAFPTDTCVVSLKICTDQLIEKLVENCLIKHL